MYQDSKKHHHEYMGRDIQFMIVPLSSVMTETTHHHDAWTPKKTSTVQMLMSGQSHPQLEGLQGTWPSLWQYSCLRDSYTFTKV